ncbi:hypothetical protein SEA_WILLIAMBOONE_170 [Gordonia phage WilliamBoone]|nr:hypothetical protein SEA_WILLIAMBOONE_170 [Gordonia phage WilliamBoone]
MSMQYGWIDFEIDESTDGIEDKFIATIGLLDENGYVFVEIAVIVHRTLNGLYPLDGEVAERKRKDAQMIVDALNAH